MFADRIARDNQTWTIYRERGFHARDVLPTQDTSRMRTARVKKEEEADTGIIARE